MMQVNRLIIGAIRHNVFTGLVEGGHNNEFVRRIAMQTVASPSKGARIKDQT